MNRLINKVVAIPRACTEIGMAVARSVAAEGGRLVLGTSRSAQLRTLTAGLRSSKRTICPQPVSMGRPKSLAAFVTTACEHFGRLDVILIEGSRTTPSQKRKNIERAIAASVHDVLYTLDAAWPQAAGARELHIINITPVLGRSALPVVASYFAAKLAIAKTQNLIPAVRLTIISPPSIGRMGARDDAAINGSIARTVLHLMQEPRSPEITELVLIPGRRE